MIKLSRPHIGEETITRVAEILRSGNLVHGKEGAAFEAELSAFLGVKHALVVSSGTAALHLALLAAGIGEGDAVIVPDFTFPATASVVSMVGARPVLVDVDPYTYCLDLTALQQCLASWRGPERLRAVMPVSEFGHPVDMVALRALLAPHDLMIIEDAACAIGAGEEAALSGTQADIGCYSFHPRKTLTTGEGGALVTNNDDLAQAMRRFRNHGMERGEAGLHFYFPGLNYRLTDFQSAIGRDQLRSLPGWIARRRELAQRYADLLQPLAERFAIALPAAHAAHSWQTYMIVLPDHVQRSAVIAALAQRGIEANLGAQCLSALGIYGDKTAPSLSVARRLYTQGMALPLYEGMSDDDVVRVVEGLGAVLAG